MAELNLTYYNGEDRYSDGNIEDVMLNMAKKGISYEDLPREEVTFPLIYHFSPMRENILNWYPFKKDATILEVGAGCGAITGVLCQKAGKVVSVELSNRRASVNYERHKEAENLCIMVGNLNDMEFGQTFDYIVLNGVLEYACSFTEGKKPFETFLKNMGGLLKEDGRFLIAIENRLGLKYFTGAPEDHTDRYFLGLENYPQVDSVRTFSKKELTTLLTDSGFPYMKFYYPYPDYKFPKEIFTDETLLSNGYGKPYRSLSDRDIYLFDDSKAARALAQEGVADIFSNSFLVEASPCPMEQNAGILYVKSSSERKKEFRILTKILHKDEEKCVRKEALTKEAKDFVKHMIANGSFCYGEGIENLQARETEGALEYPFVEGHTLFDEIQSLYDQNNKDEILTVLREFYATFFAKGEEMPYGMDENFRRLFGGNVLEKKDLCLRPANLDLICDNVYRMNGKHLVIDYEWFFDAAVPVKFLMWRALNDLYAKIPGLHQMFWGKTLMDCFEIDAQEEEIYREWSKHFVYTYVGADPLERYTKPEISLKLEDVYQYFRKERVMTSKLYYDTGKGFHEEEILCQEIHQSNCRFCVTFDLSGIKNIKNLRFDPAEETCWCRIDHVESGCGVSLEPVGEFHKQNDFILFESDDPNFAILSFDPNEIGSLVIEGRMGQLSEVVASTVEKPVLAAKTPSKNLPVKKRMVHQQSANKTGFLKRQKRKLRMALYRMPGLRKVEGHIDYFSYTKDVFSVTGWLYDRRYQMNNTRIVYYDGNSKIAERSAHMTYRYDVAAALQDEGAAMCGYEGKNRVVSPRDIRAFLEYDTADGVKRFLLGVLPGNSSLPSDQEIVISEFEAVEQLGDIRVVYSEMLSDKAQVPAEVKNTMVDIIIPVYNGYDYLASLFTSLRRTDMPYRLLIINDCSPDERVGQFLEKYVSEHSEAVLLQNETNLGFVRSVNRGLEMAEHHVVLLNTDVEVPPYWLERLMLPIICDEYTATTTPFTNSGTICSFPNFGENNDLFEHMPLWQIDQAFSQIVPTYPEMPTGIGFCMGMNLDAIRKVGFLDADTFGKGYGEENDWCRRAVAAGYRNVHVDNLFVYHKHGGSFLSEEKKRLLEKNAKALLDRYPTYDQIVADYCGHDPAAQTRRLAMLKLLNLHTEAKTIVAIDHNLGGGATAYLTTKCREYLKKGARFIILRYTGTFLVEYRYQQYYIQFTAADLSDIWPMIGRVDEIWINELVTVPKLYELFEEVLRAKKMEGARLLMLLHDYYALCPAINLVDDKGCYCHVGDTDTCNACLKEHTQNAYLQYESAEKWRTCWEHFLKGCDEVRTFSGASKDLLLKAYPELANVTMIPHKPHTMLPIHKKSRQSQCLNIGFVGAMDYKKGRQVVENLETEIKKQKKDVHLTLIGYTEDEQETKIFTQTGRYHTQELPKLTLENDIDLFFIPAIWPETFSYTTSEIIDMGMPLAVFDLGAPAERVKEYEKGCVIPLKASPADTLCMLMDFAKKCGIDKEPVKEEKVLFVIDKESYATRYRVEHFQEQLVRRGYGSDLVELSEREVADPKGYTSVVLYRIQNKEFVQKMAKETRELGIALYYDIDDLVFDYDKISYLEFLKGREYRNFREMTKKIHDCMEMADGFFTSTCALSEEIKREFPEKSVTIRRNVYSMAMELYSAEAYENRTENPDIVRIGYFSGSHTHDKDFAVVEDLLVEIMEKYPQVHLVMVGVFDTVRFDSYQERITKHPFMDWQNLPRFIANVDINLMPLEHTRFHECKSENKWMEAALVHVPSVISHNKELAGVIKNGETGFLCTTQEEWRENLKHLIEDVALRRRIGDAAYQEVTRRYNTNASLGDDAVKLVLE